MPDEPRDFYTGLVAQLYRHLRGETFDAAPYARFVRRSGEPALELGCGDGDPLLDLVADGLHVDGLDSSADMVERCRRAAAERGLSVVVHHAAMEEMDLGRRYRSIYLAGATFNLLADDAAATAALGRIAAHLEPAGAALIPLFVPFPAGDDRLGVPREHVDEHGATMRVTALAEQRDEAARTQVTTLRYELVAADGEVETTTREWVLHWHTQDGFRRLVEAAGLVVRAVLAADGRPAAADATSFTFLVAAPSA